MWGVGHCSPASSSNSSSAWPRKSSAVGGGSGRGGVEMWGLEAPRQEPATPSMPHLTHGLSRRPTAAPGEVWATPPTPPATPQPVQLTRHQVPVEDLQLHLRPPPLHRVQQVRRREHKGLVPAQKKQKQKPTKTHDGRRTGCGEGRSLAQPTLLSRLVPLSISPPPRPPPPPPPPAKAEKNSKSKNSPVGVEGLHLGGALGAVGAHLDEAVGVAAQGVGWGWCGGGWGCGGGWERESWGRGDPPGPGSRDCCEAGD